VRIGVSDRGPGIPEESLQRIFERFTQLEVKPSRSVKGFGLGLSIAKELVNLNFGDISVQSRVGEGSTFVITVPVARIEPLLSRYCERIQQMRGHNPAEPAPRFASVVQIVCDCADAETVGEVEQFLQHQIRRTDLLFNSRERSQADGAGWTLVIATNTADLGAWLTRMTSALDEVNRNRPGGALPALRHQMLGTFRLPQHMARFVAEVEAHADPAAREAPAAAPASPGEGGNGATIESIEAGAVVAGTEC
jgi:hypothetical protein